MKSKASILGFILYIILGAWIGLGIDCILLWFFSDYILEVINWNKFIYVLVSVIIVVVIVIVVVVFLREKRESGQLINELYSEYDKNTSKKRYDNIKSKIFGESGAIHYLEAEIKSERAFINVVSLLGSIVSIFSFIGTSIETIIAKEIQEYMLIYTSLIVFVLLVGITLISYIYKRQEYFLTVIEQINDSDKKHLNISVKRIS